MTWYPRLARRFELAAENFDDERAFDKEVALEVGRQVANCLCHETAPMLGRLCDYCQTREETRAESTEMDLRFEEWKERK